MDPDVLRLCGGDLSWRKLYQIGPGGKATFVLLVVLMGLLALMVFGMFAGLVFLTLQASQKAGGFWPAIKGFLQQNGCGAAIMAVVLVLLGRRIWKGVALMLGVIGDWRAPAEVWRGEVEELLEETGYRGARQLFLVINGRRISIDKQSFEALRPGQSVVAEVKPRTPMLLVLVAKP